MGLNRPLQEYIHLHIPMSTTDYLPKLDFWNRFLFQPFTGISAPKAPVVCVSCRDSVVGIALATSWMDRGSNPGEGEIFCTCPDRPWVPPSLLYNGYRVFPGGKAAGAWRLPPTLSSAEVKERVELYIYSPSRLSWHVLGRISLIYLFILGSFKKAVNSTSVRVE